MTPRPLTLFTLANNFLVVKQIMMAFGPCCFTKTVQNKAKITSNTTTFRTCLCSWTQAGKYYVKGERKVQKSWVQPTGAETNSGPFPSAIRAGGKRPGRA